MRKRHRPEPVNETNAMWREVHADQRAKRDRRETRLRDALWAYMAAHPECSMRMVDQHTLRITAGGFVADCWPRTGAVRRVGLGEAPTKHLFTATDIVAWIASGHAL